MEICQYTFALFRERLKLLFAQLFLLISSVFTEQSQICVKNAKPTTLEQGDLFWQDNWPIVCAKCDEDTHTFTDDPAQEEDLLQRHQERVEKFSQQDRVIKICADAGFLTTVEVGQYFVTRDTE